MRPLMRLSRFLRPRSSRVGEHDVVELCSLTTIGATILSPRGRFLRTNSALQDFLGYSADELQEMDVLALTHREDIAKSRDLFERLRHGEIHDFQLEKRYVRRDGAVVWAHVVLTAERRPGRERYVGLVVDITARKRAEEAQRRAERELESLRAQLESRVRERTSELELRNALLAAMQETSIDGIIATDLKRRVLALNRRLLEMWNVPPEREGTLDAEEPVWHAMALVKDPEGFRRRIVYLYTHRFEKSLDEVALRDGRVFERYSGPIVGPGGKVLGRVWYYRDITPRRSAEHELAQRTADLARSDADLENYAYAASHDLSAPVRKISAYSDLLHRSAGAKLDERERSMLALIRRSALRMAALIDDVLMLARVGREPLPLVPVDLRSVVAHAVSDLELVVSESGAQVRQGPLPRVLGQESHLRRLFQNLVSNAVKFRRPGQAPRVSVEERPSDDPAFAEISVVDDGIGFEPRFAERIFQPFLRLNPVASYEGSGIGLAICRRIVQRCGGTIRAEGLPDRGATFTVRLRRAPERPKA